MKHCIICHDPAEWVVSYDHSGRDLICSNCQQDAATDFPKATFERLP